MSEKSEISGTGSARGISRRTVVKGAAWAVPVVAVAAAAPIAAASKLPPCIAAVEAVGGTYPVALTFLDCPTADSHWDFNFTISTKSDTACACNFVRITFYDNPQRTRLWRTYTTSQQLYVQKVLAVGASGTFPTTGDVVRKVSDNKSVGTITAPGTDEDSLHTLMLPNGSLPCSAKGVMATFDVACGDTENGPWTTVSTGNQINPCVPMIAATACRTGSGSTAGYKLSITTAHACSGKTITITEVYENGSAYAPRQATGIPNSSGTSLWKGSQALVNGTASITTTKRGSGNTGDIWIEFTTDGVNFSHRRINAPTSGSC